jgi:hypothetical protein
MFSQDKQFRRPDRTPYDPSSFNVRQYEEQYGPGGVPEGWSMAATTPVQSPGLITALALFTTVLSLGLIVVGVWAIGAGEKLTTILLGLGVGTGALAMSVLAFRTAARRRRWLRGQQATTGQER